MKIMVAYDGTLRSKEALEYGIEKAKEKMGELIVLHVFNPIPFMFYSVSPNSQFAARAESARFMDEAQAILREKAAGVKTSLVLGEGDPEQEVINYAKSKDVDIILCPPRYQTIIKKYKKILKNEAQEVTESEIFDEAKHVRLAILSVPGRS